jgi:Lrp/AsnC family transcriptional regulator, leucine-responsive regulatory protein
MDKKVGLDKKKTAKGYDRIDRNILIALQKDGRMSNAALSKRVNLSPTPCLDRVRRLEREGYIESYHAKLNPAKMKASFLTYMTVSLTETSEAIFSGFKAGVNSIDQIVECHMVGGGIDYLLKIRTENMEELRSILVEQIYEIPGIASTHSYFVMESIKTTEFLQIPEI